MLLRELNGDSDSKCQQNWKRQIESYLGDLQAQKIDHLQDVEQRRLVNDKVDEISRVLDQQIGNLLNSFASPSCNSRAGASQPPSRAQLGFGSSNDGTDGLPHADEALGSAFNTSDRMTPRAVAVASAWICSQNPLRHLRRPPGPAPRRL